MEVRCQTLRPIALEVAFEVEGLTALLGPSGAGKTTLLKALAGLLPASCAPFSSLAPERRPVGYLPQHLALFPHLTAWQNVAFPLAHLPRAEREERARALLARFGLAHRADHRPSALSGGEARRVALARALAKGPRLLLLDEPTAGLDLATKGEVLRAILQAVREEGVLALVATHDPDLAQAADRVALIQAGRLLDEGPTARVYGRPASLAAARLVGFENLVPVRVLGKKGPYLEVGAGDVRLLAPPTPKLASGDAAVLAVRPEEVLIVREDRPLAPADAQNTLAGTIRCLRRLGPVVEAEFEGPLALKIRLPRHVQDRLGLRPGERRRVVLKPRYLQLFSEPSPD